MEEALLNYGIAGIMLIYFISDKVYFQRGLNVLIQNNTKALTKVYEVMQKCRKS